MTVTYYRRMVNGRINVYVADPYVERHVRTLTGRVSLTENDLRALRALGLSTAQVADPLSVVDGRPAWLTVETV